MTAPDVRQRIFDAIRLEVRDVLHDAPRPLSPTQIAAHCESAADVSDVRPVLAAMVAANEARATANGDGHAYSARTVAPQSPAPAPTGRPPTDIGQAVINGIADHNAWLTIEELERRLDLFREQIRNVVRNSKRLVGRPRAGAANGAHEYGLAEWAAEAPATDAPAADAEAAPAAPAAEKKPSTEPNGRAARVIAAITEAGDFIGLDELDAALPEDARQKISESTCDLVTRGRLLRRYNAAANRRIYGLPDWPEVADLAVATADDAERDAPAAPIEPGEARLGHRFGLWSDGTLAIETAAGELDLPPAVTHDLIAYLIRERAQVIHLFDTELETRDA
ncbi:hypothetical protein [Salinisphaera orenii]|nr:hypothetical protein [Salinisphaera halophila]